MNIKKVVLTITILLIALLKNIGILSDIIIYIAAIGLIIVIWLPTGVFKRRNH